MGDGVLVYFGYPRAHEEDGERAARAGLALVEAVPKLKTAADFPLQVRVGIATGLVVIGCRRGRRRWSVWAPPLKLADGVWFGVDDQWVGARDALHERPRLRPLRRCRRINGLMLRRTDFVPDGRRAALFGLELANPAAAAKTVTVKVDVHSELLGRVPVDRQQGHPTAADNLPGHGRVRATARSCFTDGRAAGAEPRLHGAGRVHARSAGADSARASAARSTGTVCKDGDKVAAVRVRRRPDRQGRRRPAALQRHGRPPRAARRVWIAVAGRRAPDRAKALDRPARPRRPAARPRSRPASAARRALARRPARRPQLQDAVEWGKQNLADLTQTRENLKIRFVDQGKAYPRPVDGVKRATFIGAGYPDYPWLFATDGEYTAFAGGRARPVRDDQGAPDRAARRLRRAQREVRQGRARDRHRRLGLLRRQHRPGQHRRVGQVPERGRARLALDAATTASATTSTTSPTRTLRYVTRTLDADKDGWPEGLGNVEREGMGAEKLDNAVYLIRGLYDLADMAEAKNDGATRALGGAARRPAARRASTRRGGTTTSIQYADSLGDRQRAGPAAALDRRHADGGRADDRRPPRPASRPPSTPSPRSPSARATASAARAPFNLGLFHTGCEGGPEGKGEKIDLLAQHRRSRPSPTATTAAGKDEQRRYTTANAEPMFRHAPTSSPARCPRSCRHPTRTATSTAAGPAARCSCRPGATTAPPGR